MVQLLTCYTKLGFYSSLTAPTPFPMKRLRFVRLAQCGVNSEMHSNSRCSSLDHKTKGVKSRGVLDEEIDCEKDQMLVES